MIGISPWISLPAAIARSNGPSGYFQRGKGFTDATLGRKIHRMGPRPVSNTDGGFRAGGRTSHGHRAG
jgi:hypothetical protein